MLDLPPSLRELAQAAAKIDPGGDIYDLLTQAIESETKSMRMVYDMAIKMLERFERMDQIFSTYAMLINKDVGELTEFERQQATMNDMLNDV